MLVRNYQTRKILSQNPCLYWIYLDQCYQNQYKCRDKVS